MFVFLGMLGIAETALLAIAKYYIAINFQISELAFVLLILALITGIPSVAPLVAGTALILQ